MSGLLDTFGVGESPPCVTQGGDRRLFCCVVAPEGHRGVVNFEGCQFLCLSPGFGLGFKP